MGCGRVASMGAVRGRAVCPVPIGTSEAIRGALPAPAPLPCDAVRPRPYRKRIAPALLPLLVCSNYRLIITSEVPERL